MVWELSANNSWILRTFTDFFFSLVRLRFLIRIILNHSRIIPELFPNYELLTLPNRICIIHLSLWLTRWRISLTSLPCLSEAYRETLQHLAYLIMLPQYLDLDIRAALLFYKLQLICCTSSFILQIIVWLYIILPRCWDSSYVLQINLAIYSLWLDVGAALLF